jgi:predicted DNA-binding protein
MMQQITIRMSPDDLSRLDEIAKRAGLRKSDITRIAIKRFIDELADEAPARIYDRAKRLIGVAESGLPDLGLNHRRYLMERIRKGT